MIADAGQLPLADTRYVQQVFEDREGSVRLPVGNDSRGQHLTDAGKLGQPINAGPIQVDRKARQPVANR